MHVTIWLVVDRDTGEVSASARQMNPERREALEKAGHVVAVRTVEIDLVSESVQMREARERVAVAAVQCVVNNFNPNCRQALHSAVQRYWMLGAQI